MWQLSRNFPPHPGTSPGAKSDVVELGKLLVAAVIAAIRDELARRIEFFARLREEARRLWRVGQSGRRRARVDEEVQRREGLAPRQSEARAWTSSPRGFSGSSAWA
jgi:hypothetical protein